MSIPDRRLAFLASMTGHGDWQGYCSCLGIVGLERRFRVERLEAAALRALEIQACNYPSIKSILEKGLDQVPVVQSSEREPIIHSNIRGSSYYN